MTVNTAANKTAQTGDKNETVIIPVIEEKAFIEKQVVETGKVRISKRVSEHEETIDEPLFSEKVEVERVAVNQYIDESPQIRHEGNTMIIPVVEEHLVIKKRLFLVEELRVKKEIVETHQPQSVTLRKEEIDVKRIAETENSGD
ncbi:hypothetical protein BH20ACI1_BH20ACI1_09140 [soil metagenome]